MTTTSATKVYEPRAQVNHWNIGWYDGNGDLMIKTVYGKLVLQEHHTLVMDPETKAILFSVANVNAGPVQPAGA